MSGNNEYLVGRGAVVKLSGNSKEGAVKLEGWPRSTKSGGLVTIEAAEPVLKDLYNAVNAVDGFHVLYRFGKDFGQLNISGMIYLGCSDTSSSSRSKGGAILKEVQDAYNKLRLSSQTRPINVSVAGGAKWSVALTQLHLNGSDPEFQRIRYTLTGLIIPNKNQ